jgi:hypothetical protein
MKRGKFWMALIAGGLMVISGWASTDAAARQGGPNTETLNQRQVASAKAPAGLADDAVLAFGAGEGVSDALDVSMSMGGSGPMLPFPPLRRGASGGGATSARQLQQESDLILAEVATVPTPGSVWAGVVLLGVAMVAGRGKP